MKQCLHRLGVRTPGFHPDSGGSIPHGDGMKKGKALFHFTEFSDILKDITKLHGIIRPFGVFFFGVFLIEP